MLPLYTVAPREVYVGLPLEGGAVDGIDMEVMSGIYGFSYAALLSQGQGIEGS